MNTLLSSFDQSQMSSFQLGEGQVQLTTNTARGQRPGTNTLTSTRGQAQDPFLPGLTLGGQVTGQRPDQRTQQQSAIQTPVSRGQQSAIQRPVSGGQQSVIQRPVSGGQQSHPSEILNRLSEAEQQKFLEQFLSLAPEHQGFVYRKLLTSAPDIQEFAIAQFISLDNRVLVVSIQAELDKENARKSGNSAASENQFIGPNLPQTQSSPSSVGRQQPQNFPNNPFGQTGTDLRNLNPDKLTIEELVTLQV